MIPEYQLKAADVRHQTMKTLTEHISLEANGYRCTTEMVLDVVLKASAERSSVEAACQDLVGVAASNTVREHLNAALDVAQLRTQEAEANAALAASIPSAMQRQGIEVAIDFHDEPFYGTQPDLLAVACRGKAKQGTTHFIRFASAYVIWRQVRLTLALRYVLPGEEKLGVLQALLSRLKNLHFTFRVLYLDKAFAAGPLIRYLTAIQQPAVIACPIRGKQGGTRALCRGRKSYRTDYTFTDGTTANLALVASLVPDKTGRRRRKWLAYHRYPARLDAAQDLPVLSPPVRHRMQLPHPAAGAGADHLAQSRPAFLFAGRGPDTRQHLDLLALGIRPLDRSGTAASGSPTVSLSPLHSPAFAFDRGHLWFHHGYPDTSFTRIRDLLKLLSC